MRGRRRLVLPFVALALAACNALTGASDISFCDECAPPDAARAADVVVDGSVERRDGDGVDAGGPPDGGPEGGRDADADADAAPPLGCQGEEVCERVVFVTSQTYSGSLGGVAGADAKCQALANASTIARIKGRTFLAWVSTSQTSPSLRFARGSKAYVGANNELLAFNWLDLTDGDLASAIDLDETGAQQTGSAWTGTNSNGATFSGAACTEWTSSASGTGGQRGNVGGNGGGWSSEQVVSCGSTHHLYCFEK